jgi:hypothetical protein
MAGTWTEARLEELRLRKAAGGDQAEDTVKLFAAAYPGRIGSTVFQDGDWTLEMDGIRWYYAQGRFLPEADAGRPEDFRSQFLYPYFPFVETLWQSGDREEAFSQQEWIDFLGRSVRIHQDIAAPLGRAEARIQQLAETDPEIQGWMKNLQSITGWNWRNVAGSESRSFHSYGIAVDLLMRAEAGMETYWQWTEAKGIDWRIVPAEKRQSPPAAVIRAFEDQGFIWGGRWQRYDTMHFEYHPVLLIMGVRTQVE